MKKIGFVFSLILFFSISFQVYAQKKIHYPLDTIPNYLPLQIGNQWQYLTSFSFSDGIRYQLSYNEVEADTVINGKKYYLNTGMPNFIRYSQLDQKIYTHWGDSDYVYIDFNMANGTSYQSFWDGQLHSVYAKVGNHNIFNQNRIYGGYLYLPGFWGYTEYYTDSIGLSYARSADSHASSTINIIQVILYDSTGTKTQFTNHYKPVFGLQPLTMIDSSLFNLPFSINHYYTKVVPGPFSSGLDYIDSVKMFSYYQKDDSVILNPVIIPTHSFDPVNINYIVTFQLDTAFMKNGFAFNYKFVAKDKGIIPEYVCAPDSGYYQCVWDETSDIEQFNQTPNSFSLSQNYPNPFNPSTKISWQSPVGSWQTLKVYDILGNEVATLVNEYRNAGNYEVDFQSTVNSHQLANGVYFYRIQVGNFVETKKMILLK